MWERERGGRRREGRGGQRGRGGELKLNINFLPNISLYYLNISFQSINLYTSPYPLSPPFYLLTPSPTLPTPLLKLCKSKWLILKYYLFYWDTGPKTLNLLYLWMWKYFFIIYWWKCKNKVFTFLMDFTI